MESDSSGYSWSSFFSSIKSDLSELKTSVSEGANDLYTYVKDSVPEESHSQTKEQDNNTVSLSSRLGGFLSNTINKTKSILSEVFDENQEEEDKEEVDKDEVFRVMHTTQSTYSTIKEEEKDDYEEWVQKRDIALLHSLKLDLIKNHPIIQVMYKRLVPSVVTETNFWNHYFYHMERAGYEFNKDQGVVENVPPVVESKPDPIVSRTELEGWSDVDLAENEKELPTEDFAVIDEALKEFGDMSAHESVNEDDWGEWE